MGKIMIVIEWAKQLQDSIVTFKPRENICHWDFFSQKQVKKPEKKLGKAVVEKRIA